MLISCLCVLGTEIQKGSKLGQPFSYDKLNLLSQNQNCHFMRMTNILVFYMAISLSAAISWYMVSSFIENVTSVQYCDLTVQITWFEHDKCLFKISVQLCVHFLGVFQNVTEWYVQPCLYIFLFD